MVLPTQREIRWLFRFLTIGTPEPAQVAVASFAPTHSKVLDRHHPPLVAGPRSRRLVQLVVPGVWVGRFWDLDGLSSPESVGARVAKDAAAARNLEVDRWLPCHENELL